MNVENNGPTLVTMIQLGKIFIFYISFSISWSHREPREILLVLSEEAGNQLCLGVTLICIRDPIRPSTRACPGRGVVSTQLSYHSSVSRIIIGCQVWPGLPLVRWLRF